MGEKISTMDEMTAILRDIRGVLREIDTRIEGARFVARSAKSDGRRSDPLYYGGRATGLTDARTLVARLLEGRE